MSLKHLRQQDPLFTSIIETELNRQRNNLELIASENFTSLAVMDAVGSILTNKYAEGYPDKRYYGGCEWVDRIEKIAIERAKNLFEAQHANVQPHSGSQANMAVYMAALKPGDKVLAMDLSNGGHLTHGSSVNFSGNLYDFVHYGVDPVTEVIDYDKLAAQIVEEKPKMLVAGASAYSRHIDFERMRQIADLVDAYFMVDMAHIAGLVAAGEHMNPVKYAHFVTSTTHKTLRGPRGGLILCRAEFAKDIDKSIFPGMQGGPLEHVIAGKAVCFAEAGRQEFNQHIKCVIANAQRLAKELSDRGFRIVSGGTDNHMFLVDLTSKGCTGKEAQAWLDEAHITVNKNTIPNEKLSPFVTSGIRIGTAAITSRGYDVEDMPNIAAAIDAVINSKGNEAVIKLVAHAIQDMNSKYPLYEEL